MKYWMGVVAVSAVAGASLGMFDLVSDHRTPFWMNMIVGGVAVYVYDRVYRLRADRADVKPMHEDI